MLVGFLAGVGVQVSLSQLPDLLGIHVHATTTWAKFRGTVTHLGHVSGASVAVGGAVLVVLFVGERFAPKMPVALVAVVGAIVVSRVLDLPAHGVAVVGHVPQGLPSLSFPRVAHDQLLSLFTIALSIFVIVLAQSAATSSSFAAAHNEDVDENADLVGLGVANLAAGLSGTFVVNGSPTKTGVVDRAGGRSQLAQLAMAVAVLVILVLLTKPLGWLPEPALAAVVLRIAIGLIDVRTLSRVARIRTDEFVVALVTAATVVVLGVEQGIILAVAASLVVHVRRDYAPFDAVLVRDADGTWDPTPVTDGAQTAPGLIVYRFGAGLFYANTQRFAREVRHLVRAAPDPVRCVIIDASALSDVDYTAGAMLGELERRLGLRGAALVFAAMDPHVHAQLTRYETLPVGPSGRSQFYDRVGDAAAAFGRGEIPPPEPSSDPDPGPGPVADKRLSRVGRLSPGPAPGPGDRGTSRPPPPAAARRWPAAGPPAGGANSGRPGPQPAPAPG